MADDMTVARLLDLIRAERVRLEAALAGLTVQQWTLPGACGECWAEEGYRRPEEPCAPPRRPKGDGLTSGLRAASAFAGRGR